jgi:hypothetical protein
VWQVTLGLAGLLRQPSAIVCKETCQPIQAMAQEVVPFQTDVREILSCSLTPRYSL